MSDPIADLAIVGVSLRLDFVSPSEEQALLPAIQSLFQTVPLRSADERSRVARFGWDYGGHQKVMPTPSWLEALYPRLPFIPQSMALNEYLPGRGFSPHFDPLDFDEPILILGLASACQFELSGEGRVLSFDFPARSLLSLSGPSRYPWEHGLKPVKTLRYSIVFRRLKRSPAASSS